MTKLAKVKKQYLKYKKAMGKIEKQPWGQDKDISKTILNSAFANKIGKILKIK